MSCGFEVPTTEIVQALLQDISFEFKDQGGYLRKGICPSCGKRELFIKKDSPWVVKCGRENKCGWTGTTRELLPDVFANYAERYRPTEQEPNRTADAYLAMDRGFDLSKIRGWYEQAFFQIPDTNTGCPAVRFYLNEDRKNFWQRLIDPPKGVKKARFHGSYKGHVWAPPGFELQKGDRCMIVEGIFHAIALVHAGYKAVSAFSSNHFPDAFIESHKGKGIAWSLALDGDQAGRKWTRKHAEKLAALGEKWAACMVPEGREDWDDLWRAKRITDRFMEDCYFRGKLFMAKTVNEKAYHHYCRYSRNRFILDFDNALYSIHVSEALVGDLVKGGEEDINIESEQGLNLFMQHCNVDSIANCLPRFLYMERDELMGEQWYRFKISYKNGSPDDLIALEGSHLDSPAAFNKALLNRTGGGTFDGDARHMKILRDRWFNNRMLTVSSIPFIGYDRDTKAWVFQDRAYNCGRELALNSEGFFQVATQGIKTSLVGVNINTDGKFDPRWLKDYVRAFHWQGLAMLAFWLGSLFVQQIRAEHKTWPFMEYTGEPGAGKSTVLEFLWKCVGRDDYEGFDVMKATNAGRRRAFNQVSNLPVVLIESDRDNGDKNSKARMFDFDAAKPFYNGRGTGTLGVAKRNNSTEEHLFQASLVISQNAEVDGSEALLQRIVHCHADKAHHKPGTREIARRFERQTTSTVGGFLREALKAERRIMDTYLQAFPVMEARFSAGDLKNERIIKNHAQIAAAGEALGVLFPDMDKDLIDRLTNYLAKRALAREERLAADHPLVEQFWDTYEFINAKRGTDGDKYPLNHSRDEGRIAVNLNHYRSECLALGQELPDLAKLKKLLPHSKRQLFVDSNKTVRSRIKGRSIKCWLFQA